jgi:hypothetical protein
MKPDVSTKRACAAGALLLAVIAFRPAASAQTPARAETQSAPADPAIESAVMQVLNDYLRAFNRLDVAAWERTFHFPHYRLASGRMTVLDRPGLQTVEQLRGNLGPDRVGSQPLEPPAHRPLLSRQGARRHCLYPLPQGRFRH